jgi:hypothetical protein
MIWIIQGGVPYQPEMLWRIPGTIRHNEGYLYNFGGSERYANVSLYRERVEAGAHADRLYQNYAYIMCLYIRQRIDMLLPSLCISKGLPEMATTLRTAPSISS